MIHAWEKNKLGVKEDIFSSSFFGLLFYLPIELSWDIIKNSCYSGDKLPKYSGQVKNIEYWPHWSSSDTENSKYVEPDIFVEFDDFDLIIEVKRDTNNQYKGQWINEITAYLNEIRENSFQQKKVYLLAVGGINSEEDEFVEVRGEKFHVLKFSWQNILNETKRTKDNMIGTGFLNTNVVFERIVNDMITVFKLNGYLTVDWFSNIPKNYTITQIDKILNWSAIN